MKAYCAKNALQRIVTTPYHPQANGRVEHLNGSLVQLIAKLSQEHPNTVWPECKVLRPAISSGQPSKKVGRVQAKPLQNLKDLAHTVEKRFVLAFTAKTPSPLLKLQAQPASEVPTKQVCDPQSNYPVTQSQNRKSTQITKSNNMNR
ncbi:hypothetical protein DSO57_1000085 [Entomophthora muscae]|uniref:Uncharacterized protein n=1 Tax=Entomophthora muscae TaxID=34485 RepID=A0ACC2SM80_9FUNG|nr:hypothetical protein DSO57_1000085 [Entomophthora muscae]